MRKKQRVECVLIFAAVTIFCVVTFRPDSVTSESRPENVILFVVDTLRADHLQCYGYGQSTSPNLSQFSQYSHMFTNAYTTFPATTPSFASVMTGKLLHNHGVFDNCYKGYSLAENQTTIAEKLKAAGYATGAFISGWTIKRNSGLHQGFDVYDDQCNVNTNSRPGMNTLKHAIRWMETNQSKPFFLFIHLFDPHGPYTPPDSGMSMVSSSPKKSFEPEECDLTRIPVYQRQNDISDPGFYIRQYDHEILYADRCFGEILNACQRLNLTDNTLIVFTADHGEELIDREKWFDHGCHLFDEQVRIPLIVRCPGTKAATVVSDLVRNIDIAPTILDYLRLPPLPDSDGIKLQISGDEPDTSTRVAYLESGNEPGLWSVRGKEHTGRCYGVRTGDWKLIYTPNLEGSTYSLFNMDSDPGETKNVIADFPVVCDPLIKQLSAFMTDSKASHNNVDFIGRQLSERDEDVLKALGYIH